MEPESSSIGQILQFLQGYWAYIVLGSLLFNFLYLRYLHPLHKVRGPWWASVTRFWLLRVFLGGRAHFTYLELHKKYGPVIRISPNTVIVDNSTLFGDYFKWDKSEWWQAFQQNPHIQPHGNILEAEAHKASKRRIAGGYTMSQVVKYDNVMDRHVMELMKQFSRRQGTIFDISPWTQWVAFDIVMDVVFSNPLGFVENATDVGGYIHSIHGFLTIATIAGLFPWIARLIQIPWLFAIIGPKPTDTQGPGRMLGLAAEQISRRYKEPSMHEDILQWWMTHEDKDGQRLTRGELEQESLAPINAGSDTTATVLRSAILQTATNSRVLNKLLLQIDTADAKGLLSTPPSLEEVDQHVTYVKAIVKEALRVLPVVGMPLFRSVPKGGAKMGDFYLPAGTEVGFSHWAIARNPALFGSDVDLFRPERWTDEVNPDVARVRDSADIFFGQGPMACTGRNIATLEVYKLLIQFFRTFDVEVVNMPNPWKESNSLAMLHRDFFVKLTERERGKEATGNGSPE